MDTRLPLLKKVAVVATVLLAAAAAVAFARDAASNTGGGQWAQYCVDADDAWVDDTTCGVGTGAAVQPGHRLVWLPATAAPPAGYGEVITGYTAEYPGGQITRNGWCPHANEAVSGKAILLPDCRPAP